MLIRRLPMPTFHFLVIAKKTPITPLLSCSRLIVVSCQELFFIITVIIIPFQVCRVNMARDFTFNQYKVGVRLVLRTKLAKVLL